MQEKKFTEENIVEESDETPEVSPDMSLYDVEDDEVRENGDMDLFS